MKNLLGRLDSSYIYAFLSELTLGLTLLLHIVLARVLGPEQFGLFAAATAIAAILSLFIQCGFPMLAAREVAANPIEGSKFTAQYLLLEGLNSLPVLLLLFPLSRLLNFEGQGVVLCYLAVFAEVCRSIKQTLRAVLRGQGWFRAESISVSIERTCSVLAASLVLLLSQNLLLVMGSLVLVRCLDNLGLVYYLSRQVKIWEPPSLESLRKLLSMAAPFALSGVLLILYYQVDLVMLRSLSSSTEVGLYSAAYRIIEIFSALPRVLFYVFITRFSRCYAKAPHKLSQEIYQSTCILLMSVLPVLFIASCFQQTLISKIYGEAFAPAVLSFSIIIPSISLNILSGLIRKALTAARKEKAFPPLLITTIVLNIVINFLLIPRLGAIGAAIATLLSELTLLIMSSNLLKTVGSQTMSRCFISTGAMSLLLIGTPSLIARGLNLSLGIGLITLSITSILVSMYYYSRSLKQLTL